MSSRHEHESAWPADMCGPIGSCSNPWTLGLSAALAPTLPSQARARQPQPRTACLRSSSSASHCHLSRQHTRCMLPNRRHLCPIRAHEYHAADFIRGRHCRRGLRRSRTSQGRRCKALLVNIESDLHKAAHDRGKRRDVFVAQTAHSPDDPREVASPTGRCVM